MDEVTLQLLEALESLYAVLDTKTVSGLAVNQVLTKEISDLFYNPAIKARIAIESAKNVLDTSKINK